MILAYGEEPDLPRAVHAAAASREVDAEVLVVDNGFTDQPALAQLEELSGVRILRPGSNLGFAGGCNLAARASTGEVIALVNGDAVVDPQAVQRLAAVACRPGVGLATASLRLAADPALMNSAGNPVHFLGFSWAGGLGQPADRYRSELPVTSASGAALAIRRSLWEQLGGFADEFFAYHEDTELSLRCWQQDRQVRFVPDAVVHHRYEFSRNAGKLYLLERNRLILLMTLYQRRTLLLLLPVLILTEAAMLILATRQGWARQKLAGWLWLARHHRWVRRRRARLQGERTVPDRRFAALLTGDLHPEAVTVPPLLSPANKALARYWTIVRRLL